MKLFVRNGFSFTWIAKFCILVPWWMPIRSKCYVLYLNIIWLVYFRWRWWTSVTSVTHKEPFWERLRNDSWKAWTETEKFEINVWVMVIRSCLIESKTGFSVIGKKQHKHLYSFVSPHYCWDIVNLNQSTPNCYYYPTASISIVAYPLSLASTSFKQNTQVFH